jgi:hypothetical protein
MMLENVDQRALGAIRFVDATTGLWVLDQLVIESDVATFLRNGSGTVVITSARGLADHVAQFEAPPADPPIGSIKVTLFASDPRGRYLARRSTLALPRDASPAAATTPDSLFQPVDVVLYPSPSAPTGSGWALIRASVFDQNGGRLAGALLRVMPTGGGGKVIARGLTDERGEALVCVTGIAVTTWGADAGPVVATEIDAAVEAIFDKSAKAPPDPDALESSAGTLPKASTNVKLSSGKQQIISLNVTVP